MQARHEVDQAFRVGGKVAERKVDVGQTVREGDVLAVLDDTDYRLAEEAAPQQLVAATAQARQAESDRQRLEALKKDGSVSVADDEQARSSAQNAQAAAEAAGEEARARPQPAEVHGAARIAQRRRHAACGSRSARSWPKASRSSRSPNEGEPEIVVDVPEDHLEAFKTSRFKASLASAPDEAFDVVLRELSPQAAPQTRTYRARLKPATPRPLPLGATATLVVERPAGGTPVASIPASAITQSKGSRRCGSFVARAASRPEPSSWSPSSSTAIATTKCSSPGRPPVRSSSPPASRRWRPGCASRSPAPLNQRHQAGRPMKSFNLTEWALNHRAIVLFLILVDCRRRRAGLHQARPARRPELLGAVDDGDGDLARRDSAAGPGRGAQPHGEEVRAARPLREGQDLRAPGLRRHD